MKLIAVSEIVKLPFATYTVFRARRVTFFLVNRVEHQKLNQTTPYGAVWLSFWCSTLPSADGSHLILPII